METLSFAQFVAGGVSRPELSAALHLGDSVKIRTFPSRPALARFVAKQAASERLMGGRYWRPVVPLTAAEVAAASTPDPSRRA